MAKRMALMLAAMAAFIGIVARQEDWQATLGAIGTVAAVNGVNVGADLPGVVRKIAFESGNRVD